MGAEWKDISDMGRDVVAYTLSDALSRSAAFLARARAAGATEIERLAKAECEAIMCAARDLGVTVSVMDTPRFQDAVDAVASLVE